MIVKHLLKSKEKTNNFFKNWGFTLTFSLLLSLCCKYYFIVFTLTTYNAFSSFSNNPLSILSFTKKLRLLIYIQIFTFAGINILWFTWQTKLLINFFENYILFFFNFLEGKRIIFYIYIPSNAFAVIKITVILKNKYRGANLFL